MPSLFFRRVARTVVEGAAPGVGRAIRSARDRRWLETAAPMPHGFRLVGPPAYRDPAYEADEQVVFIAEAKAADAVIDVGANIGFYTCLARSLGRHTIAVEPLARNLRFLYRNLALNGFDDIEVFPVGVGRAPTQLQIGGFADVASFIPGWSPSSAAATETVAISTLDILVGDRFKGRNLLIKMDVEGFEYEALLGAEKCLHLEPRPHWLVEIFPENPLVGGPNPRFAETFDLFFAAGYRAMRVATSQQIGADDLAQVAATPGDFNFLFTD